MFDKLSGFDNFKKHIEKLQENVKGLEGQHNIPFDELFPACVYVELYRFLLH